MQEQSVVKHFPLKNGICGSSTYHWPSKPHYHYKTCTSKRYQFHYRFSNYPDRKLYPDRGNFKLLGVGVPITQPSLGLLVKTGFDVLFSGLWWASVFPGLYIMLIVFGINLLGDFLRDELNPNLK